MSATGINEAKLEAFMEQAVTDMGAIISAPLFIGEKLGLYKAMANAGPLTSEEVAERSGAAERCVREWLRNQAAGGDVTYDADERHYTPRTRMRSPWPTRTARSTSSACTTRSRRCSRTRTSPRPSGPATGWAGTSMTTACSGAPSVLPAWVSAGTSWRNEIPALDGVQEKLEAGAKVADGGCGHGASTVIMAAASRTASFHGLDYHPESIERREARPRRRRGSGTAISFETALAKDYPGTDSTWSACSTACTTWATPPVPPRTCAESLAPDGSWMIVEPFADDGWRKPEPCGRVFYGASTVICTPAVTRPGGWPGAGAQAGRRAWRR